MIKSVIRNCIDNFKQSQRFLDDDPNLSLITFSIATELLLKARLMHEHWSLIVERNPDKERFKQGDFKSIPLRDLVKKIHDVTEEKFSNEFKKQISKLVYHRNKLIHFCHDAYLKGKNTLTEDIAIEQLSIWYELFNIINNRWGSLIFTEESYGEIVELNEKFQINRKYYVAKYNKIKPKIEVLIAKGKNVIKCQNCDNLASIEVKKSENISKFMCEVCSATAYELSFKCPSCRKDNATILNILEESVQCKICQDELIEHLREWIQTFSVQYHHDDVVCNGNCGECCEYETVHNIDDYYICHNCFHIEEVIQVCEWCHSYQLGGNNLEMSFFNGCEYCDGRGYD